MYGLSFACVCPHTQAKGECWLLTSIALHCLIVWDSETWRSPVVWTGWIPSSRDPVVSTPTLSPQWEHYRCPMLYPDFTWLRVIWTQVLEACLANALLTDTHTELLLWRSTHCPHFADEKGKAIWSEATWSKCWLYNSQMITCKFAAESFMEHVLFLFQTS